ncbi:MAG TPA: YceI family protein [Gemmatimonadales bacterium]|nr:YceI family protein [Gemmatimonadales bacterium]
MTHTAAPGATTTWQLDPAHSSVEFAVKHMMMTTVRGRFKNLQATLTGNEEHPDGCCVEAVLDVASIDTGNPDRDTHLRSADFFDAERHPHITFRSKRVIGNPSQTGDRFKLLGDLVIRESTSEVTLDCVFEGRGTDPWGKERAGFSATTEIDRRDWGLRWNQTIETGGVLVAHNVRIEAEVQFVRTD